MAFIGKADSLNETPFETARREASEEIGLPKDYLPPPFRVEHLCELPSALAVTEMAVRPCVAFLHTDNSMSSQNNNDQNIGLDVTGENLIHRLNTSEVAAVFSAPFHRFLSSKVEGTGLPSPIGYSGSWKNWHGVHWMMHNFLIPREQLNTTAVEKAKVNPGGVPSTSSGEYSDHLDEGNHFRVWGLTAHILVDSARIAYGEDPEFEFTSDIGEEKTIRRLLANGRLAGEKKKNSTIPRGEMESEKKNESKNLRSTPIRDRAQYSKI
jgi:peroxisomal coenzyme A diphosphatase NUDT7